MDLRLFLPETVLCGAVGLFLCLALAKNVNARTLNRLAGLFAAAAVAAAVYSWGTSGDLFYGTYRVDLLAQTFKALIALGLLFTVCLSGDALSIAPVRGPPLSRVVLLPAAA